MREIDVIDVSYQMDFKMLMREWTEYYNSPDRRKIFNVISLEFSNTSLASLVTPPRIVTELSWVSKYWQMALSLSGLPLQKPEDNRSCRMGVKDSFTDFHVDFDGTSVWYHILRGQQVFYFVRPTPSNLVLYERWLSSSKQSEMFLADKVDNCYKCLIKQGQTLFIPTGWIYAVLTQIDSLVFGGNFLHDFNIEMQLKIYEIGKRVKTLDKYLFASFEMLHWYEAKVIVDSIRNCVESGSPVPQYMRSGTRALFMALKSWTLKIDPVRQSIIPITVQHAKLLKDLQKLFKDLNLGKDVATETSLLALSSPSGPSDAMKFTSSTENSNDKHSRDSNATPQKKKKLATKEKKPERELIVVDTNVLISNMTLLRNWLGNAEMEVTFYLPWTVIQEIDKIKDKKIRRSSKPEETILIKKAKGASRIIFTWMKNGTVEGQSPSEVPRVGEERHGLLVERADDKILACCLDLKEKGSNVILLTNDKNLHVKAIMCKIKAHEPKTLDVWLRNCSKDEEFEKKGKEMKLNEGQKKRKATGLGPSNKRPKRMEEREELKQPERPVTVIHHPERKPEAYVTLATNDDYALGAMVVGVTLRKTGTTHKIVVMVPPEVSQEMRHVLSSVYDVIFDVWTIESRDFLNLRLLGRSDLGVTFTKIHCWRLIQFSKCVFMDADTIVLSNVDDLFDRDELSAAPDAGWPDCFNSGVFVYIPSLETFEALSAFARSIGSFDGGDQGLLNLFFYTWATEDIRKHLPFTYNLHWQAFYSYQPAYKQFGHKTKIVHFIGAMKPWHFRFNVLTCRVEHEAETVQSSDLLQLWWDVFTSRVIPQLSPAMKGLCGQLARLKVRALGQLTPEQLADRQRQYNWERNLIDYMGRDCFANIKRRLDEVILCGGRQPEPSTRPPTPPSPYSPPFQPVASPPPSPLLVLLLPAPVNEDDYDFAALGDKPNETDYMDDTEREGN